MAKQIKYRELKDYLKSISYNVVVDGEERSTIRFWDNIEAGMKPKRVPVVSKTDLMDYIMQGTKRKIKEQPSWLHFAPRNMEDVITSVVIDILTDNEHIMKGIHQVKTDLELVRLVAEENTDTGIPYLLIEILSQWEIQFYVAIFWNGEEVEVYIPRKGNTFNMKDMTAFADPFDGISISGYKNERAFVLSALDIEITDSSSDDEEEVLDTILYSLKPDIELMKKELNQLLLPTDSNKSTSNVKKFGK